MSEESTWNPKLSDSKEPEEQDEALDETTLRVVAKAVVSEGERSVAIDQAQGSVINTGEIQGSVNIINVSLSQGSQESTLTTSDIGSAVNLVKLTQSLSSELSKRIAAELENAREVFREGKTQQSFQDVRRLLTSPNWQALDDSLRAMILRALANMVLSLKGKDGIDEAQAYINDASHFDPAATDQTALARIKLLRDGFAAGLAELGNAPTLDAFNLRVGILIETDQPDEALKVLASPPTGIALDAESQRLRAIALLLSCDLEGARGAISEPLKRMPRRQNVRLAAAVIDYHSSLSPLALQRQAVAYPHPVNPAMVKRDDESQGRLRSAAQQFAEVAAQMELGSNSQKEVETWQIACLANISDGMREAVDLCKSALLRDPMNFRVLAWVLYRGYEIDLAQSEDALKKLLGGPVNEEYRIHYVLALLGIYLKKEANESVLELLDAERALFESSGHADLWLYWRGQALVIGGQPDLALNQLAKIQQRKLRDNIQVLALCEIANRDGNWEPIIEYLEAAWEETKDPQFLIHLCEIKAQIGDWDYVADRAEEYCDRVGTASSAYFAISAARSAGRHQLCLHFLQKYEHLFPGDVLPVNLRRVRVYSKLNVKDITGALTEAERLVGEDDSVEDIFTLLDVLRAKGDLPGIEATVKRLRNRDLTALQCLQLAALIRVENSDLAREFWRRAKGEAQNDKSLAPVAVDLAFKLGLDREIGPLWERVHEVAQSEDESIQVFDIEQVLATMRHQQEALEKIQELYGSGEAPLALVVQRVKRPIVDLFNSLADENQSTSATKWHQRPRLFIRHGARLLPPSENFRNSSEWRLHLDGTALVLADHLGLLDKIEQTFKPLRISAKLPAALLAQRNELLDIQQSRLTICQAIVSLVEQGKLRSFKSGSPTTDLEMLQAVLEQSADDQGSKTSSGEEESELLNHERSKHAQASREGLSIQLGAERIAMLAEALRVDGFAVGLLPLRAYGNTQMAVLEIPDLLRSHVINCRAVVDSMQGQDRMSAPMFERALKGLGQEANPNVSPATPLVGAKLYLIDGAADVLAGAEVLDRACESFEVAVSEQCILEARTTLQEYSRRAAVAAQAQKLVQRISAGLEDGRYEFIPISDQRLKETADFEESESLDVAAMAELFRYESVNWDILWIDDRAINKHPFIGSAPIIGINEILMALRQREVIDKHEYYDLVLKLRVQNFRYVPIDEAEILYHLRKAPINNGVVTETENTAILRRYVASCLLDKDYLQPELTPEGARNPLGEHAFITNCLITFTGAIAACWTDDSATSEIARARADWIFDNLYVGLFGVLHLQERNHPGLLPFRLLARDIAGLLMKAITIGDPLHPERHSEKRSAYFGWLSERAITARFRSEPRILKSAGGEMARMFAAFSRVDEQQEDQRIVEKILLQKLFLDLPDDVQTEIELDEQTREWLGVTTFPAVVVGGFTFDSSEFVSAVEAALSGAHPTINPQGSETELRFALIEAEQGKAEGLNSSAIGVSNSDNQRIAVLGDPTLNVLSSEVEVRKATLRQFRDWFDGGDEEFEIEVDQIAKLTDPQERLERVHQLHSESGEVFYVSVEERLRQRKLSSENLTPVFARTLLKRLRLPPSFELDFSGLWEESAGKLLSEVGIERTIERCSLVPVPMPSAVIEALKMLPPNEQTEIIDRLFVQSASPVTRLHLANLALRVKGEAASAKAQQILSDLYDQELGEADFAAFAAILNFVNGEIETCRDSGEISPQLRLAITWAHASHVHNIFHAVGFSAADIAVIFQQHTRQLNARTMLREPALWDDCLHPHGINRTVFLTHGVSKMFAGIDREKLEEIGIVPMIEEEIILDVNGTKIPKVPLLHDSSLENDGLNSILGGDHATALALVLNDDEVELLSSGKLRQIVEQSLDQILVDRDLSAWVSIMFVLGDLPIYSDLREKFRAALKSIEIDAAFMASPGIAHAALSTAANQIRHWGDEELRASTGDKILAALTFEIERDTSPIDGTSATDGDTRERRLVDLVDAALKLSI
ncbi:MAG TPA: hypothetical protein VMZ30_22970, partial [Pyrinomonadaceae bacterium]|nr:hypothetical protein [Pyrinomonadaceae bacterium]